MLATVETDFRRFPGLVRRYCRCDFVRRCTCGCCIAWPISRARATSARSASNRSSTPSTRRSGRACGSRSPAPTRAARRNDEPETFRPVNRLGLLALQILVGLAGLVSFMVTAAWLRSREVEEILQRLGG